MSKVTSKLQLTVPKTIADQYGIRAGDEVQWIATGEVIRVVPTRQSRASANEALTRQQRLEMFDNATQRQRQRQAGLGQDAATLNGREDRGWTREDIYDRGIPR